MGRFSRINMSEKSPSEYISSIHTLATSSIIYREFKVECICGIETEKTISTDDDYTFFKIALLKKLDHKS